MADKFADLVLEGGGVKGIGLVGAYSVIEERGYTIKRIAGTSAGSIVGALLAAGLTAKELEREMSQLDYADFQDEGLLDRLPLVGKPLSLLLNLGIYNGKFAREWVHQRLAEHRVQTFADLPYNDAEHPLEKNKQFRLVVITSDISRGDLRRLPWHYPLYNCDPGEQVVADAVRASMSIPYFFKPIRLRDQDTGRNSILVDGGMLSNFPVDVFDAPSDREPRWPTFGIKLSAKARSIEGTFAEAHGPISMTKAMVRTMTGFYDRLHIDDPAVQDRTIFVDTGTVRSTDFHLKKADRDFLYASGRAAAEEFFDGSNSHEPWDWEVHKAKYRHAG